MTNKITDERGREYTREQLLRQVPDTWRSIVDKMLDDLFTAGWGGVFRQIKEKYGSLRFYFNGGGREDLYSIVDKAEEATAKICIQCGKPATATTTGWYTHVCDEHKE